MAELVEELDIYIEPYFNVNIENVGDIPQYVALLNLCRSDLIIQNNYKSIFKGNYVMEQFQAYYGIWHRLRFKTPEDKTLFLLKYS